jgi:hypothetical protein
MKAVTKEAVMQYRQGDVLLMKVKNLPCAKKAVKRENGRMVLAHGETTGHAHVVADPKARFWQRGDERYLEVPDAAQLTHEEHGAIALPPGLYRVIRQREYVPASINDPGHKKWGSRYVWD